ncbi:hypothetical protein IQ277_27895 [Nostocales cyanobacterium LEGE 12452]|nr:hypothetical protein [Nostocales cyanobacterium LEGE 12452]
MTKQIQSTYSASGYYAIQFFSLPSPIKAFRFGDVPHSCRKCCKYLAVVWDFGAIATVQEEWRSRIKLLAFKQTTSTSPKYSATSLSSFFVLIHY